MAEGKNCSIGVRNPVDIKMLNEIIRREVKHFRNYEVYRPNFGFRPVMGKFYAAHDQLESESAEEKAKVDAYYTGVSQTRALGPQSKFPFPVTSNQVYGWYYKPVYPMDRNDPRFYFPLVESAHTKMEIVIAMSNPKTKPKE